MYVTIMPCCCDIWQVYSRAHTLCHFSIPPCLSCRHWHWVTTQSVSASSISGTLSQYSLSWLTSVLTEISVLKLCYYLVISLTTGKIHIVQYNQCWDSSAALVLVIDIKVSRLAIGFQKVCIIRLPQCTNPTLNFIVTLPNHCVNAWWFFCCQV